MILGTGIDLIEVARIRASHEKFGERFLQRILRPAEIAYCISHKDPAPFLAARFAARGRFPRPSAQASARNSAGKTWKWGARKAASRL